MCDSPVVKEGRLKLYSFEKKVWRDIYCRLKHSGWFSWYEKEKSNKPINGVDLKVVSGYFAFGELVRNLPIRPLATTDYDLMRVFAVPVEPNEGCDICFFLCYNDAEMCSWITSIFRVLDTPVPEKYRVAVPASYRQSPIPDAQSQNTLASPMGQTIFSSMPSLVTRALSPISYSSSMAPRQTLLLSPPIFLQSAQPIMQTSPPPMMPNSTTPLLPAAQQGNLGFPQSTVIYRVLQSAPSVPPTPFGHPGTLTPPLTYPAFAQPVGFQSSHPYPLNVEHQPEQNQSTGRKHSDRKQSKSKTTKELPEPPTEDSVKQPSASVPETLNVGEATST